ncbi:helix-turn-helix domain-containing protein [Streptomyces blattellae]|uniref:hypothetical protein n=1 Tax=Streptomyces blattellae TaxID=2569855 RepID=UPI0012B812F8|nr:hypothetical protein [Streptomyces blattellae]
MTDKLVPQTLAPNALILGELKPSVFMRWIDLAMDLGSLDYNAYQWEELQERWGIGKKPVQTMVRTLEAAGWLSSEKTRDGVRIYLFPTNDAAESHLKRIKAQTEDAWKRNTGKRLNTAVDKQPYRNQYMVDKGNFTKVPETILKDGRFSLNELATYVVIRCTTNASSFWGTRKLATAAGVSQPTLTKALKTLKESGYLVYDGVQRVSNRYDFNDMPESLFSQMESVFSQSEPVFSQRESLFSPINTEYNTEERILTTTTDQGSEAAKREEPEGSPGLLDSPSGELDKELEEVSKDLPLVDVVDANASPTPGETNTPGYSFSPRSKKGPSKKSEPSATSANVPAPRNRTGEHHARLDKQAAAHRAEQMAKQELVQARTAQFRAELAELYGEPVEESQTAVRHLRAQQ